MNAQAMNEQVIASLGMTAPVPVPLTDASLEDGRLTALLAGSPVLVEVSTLWCMPCRLLAPLVPPVARAFGLRHLAVDADACPALVRHLGVEAFPELLVVRDGAPAGRLAGYESLAALGAGLRAIMGGPADGAAWRGLAAAEREARQAYEAELEGPRAEVAACLDLVAPDLDALQADLARGVADGTLTQALSSERLHAAYARLTAPFRPTLDAAGDEEEAALARYECSIAGAVGRGHRAAGPDPCGPEAAACRLG